MALTYELLTDLQPKILTGIAIKKTQGTLFATDFLPERAHPGMSGYYKTYNDVAFGQLAPQVGETDEDQLLNTTYAESSFAMKPFRIGGEISEMAVDFLLAKDSDTAVARGRQLIQDEVEFLAETIALREEKDILDKINTSAASVNNFDAQNGAWSVSTSTPIKDVREAIRRLQVNYHVVPDTMLISPTVENDLLNHADLTDIFKYSGLQTLISSPGLSRAIPKFLGLDVYVSSAVTMSGIASGGTETGLVGDTTVLVFKRGADLGVTFVAEPLTTRRWEVQGRRAIHIQMFKTFIPVIFRSKMISKISGV